VALANGVPQGLVAAGYTDDPHRRAALADRLEAGILKLGAGPMAIAADAPFSGWKASALGPPEHGRWDLDFYTRLQTVYP
jgi:acyl-CoA reductase-like NAD-dependent aldehyde dehydrogenase